MVRRETRGSCRDALVKISLGIQFGPLASVGHSFVRSWRDWERLLLLHSLQRESPRARPYLLPVATCQPLPGVRDPVCMSPPLPTGLDHFLWAAPGNMVTLRWITRARIFLSRHAVPSAPTYQHPPPPPPNQSSIATIVLTSKQVSSCAPSKSAPPHPPFHFQIWCLCSGWRRRSSPLTRTS